MIIFKKRQLLLIKRLKSSQIAAVLKNAGALEMVVGGYINRPLPINFFQNYSHISSVKNWVSIWLSIELVPDILNKAFAISVAKILQREQNTILNQ